MVKKAVRFDPKSRWVRYHKATELWIPNRKRIYLYWFKFLQHAERHQTKVVDWSKYEGWGGANEVLGSKFDDWWGNHWIDLFGYKKGEQPKHSLSTNRPKPDGIRYALLVYENLHRGSNWEIAIWLQKKESQKRYGVQSLFFASENVVSGSTDRQEIQSKIGRYKRAADKYLDNVCVGKFP